ncbi:hypothetical protein CF017_19475 [Citrobacter braakii]|nr:hypothetical protein CF017_19475 [Citrobacter braakii]
MIFLIFIKNIKKMNCLVFIVCLDNNSKNVRILSNYILGNFLDNVFYRKILSFFVIFTFQGLLRCYLIQMIIFWRGNSGSQLMEPLE